MPTYDYECNHCGHTFELFQNINDSVKRKCPDCGQLRLKRLFGTGAAVVFKGSGFYQTDYRSESYKKAADKEKKSVESKTDSSSNGKSEKPAAKKQSGGSETKPSPKAE